MAEYVCELPVEDMLSFVSGTTTIPVHERIVRCRDCEHFTPNEEFWFGPILAATCGSCDFWAGTKCKVTPDGFCAWGERRAE